MFQFLAATRAACRRAVTNHLRHKIAAAILPAAVLVAQLSLVESTAADRPSRPNIIFVMADDLGYGDLGCYGQKVIATPKLDQMAREGLLFRQFYAGCTVCAPSRSVLMTGQHMGHTYVRGNAGRRMGIQSLRAKDVTVAEVLKQAGYATALCGKWGLGDAQPGDTGLPNDQGFDFFYGYLNQVHAHNYYPEFLWRNKEKVPLKNVVVRSGKGYGGFTGGYATKRSDYSHDLIMEQALAFVRQNRSRPFFLYLSLTIPHANNEGTRGTGNGQEVPDYGQYADRSWSDANKGYAAMVTRMDRDMGRLFDELKKLGIDERTVVMFTSDNGPQKEGGQDPELFDTNGPLRGMKRDLYEGGIRVPMIVRWPGQTPAGAVTDHIGYFGDLMATAAELSGGSPPPHIDSISFVPTITGRSADQRPHRYLYWEFYERGSKQAVRAGKWKAVRMPMIAGKTELYDLESDLSESRNVAAEHPEIVRKLEAMMDEAHVPNPNWTVPPAKKQRKR